MEFRIIGEPVAKGRPKMTRQGHAYTPAKTRTAETNVRAQVVAQLPSGFIPLKGAIHIQAIFYRQRPKSDPKRIFPTTRCDIDNYMKLLMDAINTVVFEDDSQVVDIEMKKRFGVPGIWLSVEELYEPQKSQSKKDKCWCPGETPGKTGVHYHPDTQ